MAKKKKPTISRQEFLGLLDLDELLGQVTAQWAVVQQDGEIGRRLAAGGIKTPAEALDILLDRARSRLEPGAISADLRLDARASAEVTVYHPSYGETDLMVPGMAGLVGRVKYRFGAVELKIVWVSHPFHQYHAK